MRPTINSQQRQVNFNRFLICGLGSLGQQCVVALKEFGVAIEAIEAALPQSWEIPDLPNLLDELIIGDCRQEAILEQAKIRQCRAVLLVTSSERVNIEAAFAARSLNPNTRLVVRSAKENLNELAKILLVYFVSIIRQFWLQNTILSQMIRSMICFWQRLRMVMALCRCFIKKRKSRRSLCPLMILG